MRRRRCGTARRSLGKRNRPLPRMARLGKGADFLRLRAVSLAGWAIPRGSRSRRARRASRQARRRSRRGWRRALATVRGSSCVPWVEISSVFRSKRARRRWISQPVSRVPGRGPCCRGQEQMKPSLSAEQPYDSSEPSGGETHGGGRDGRDGKGRGALLRAAQGRLPLVFGRPTSPS